MTRSLPPGHQYLGRPGRKASLRNLRQLCRRELAQRDPAAMVALSRAAVLTADTPWPEHAALMLLNRAREESARTGAPWPALLEALVESAIRERQTGRGVVIERIGGPEEGAS